MHISRKGLRLAIHWNINDRYSNRISFALCSVLFIPAINNFLNSFFEIGLSISLDFLTPFSYIFMAFISVFVLYKNIWRRKIYFVLVLLFLFGASLSYLIYPEIRDVIYNSPVDLVYSPINKLFFFCIPALIGVACLKNYTVFLKQIYVWGRVTVILGIVTYCFAFFCVGRNLQYMVYSYFMLLPICCCYESTRINNSKLDLIVAVVGSICILMCGARGAIISLIMYFLVRFAMGGIQNINLNKIFKLLVLFTVVFVIYFFYEELLLVILNILDRLEINSRFFTMLAQGDVFEDSARDSIFNSLIEAIKNNPIGYGLYGDRFATGKYGDGKFRYAHNIILELMCDFGVIGGSIVIGVVTKRILKLFVHLRNRQEVSLVLLLLPYGVFQLFFSSSFLENVPFFILIGLSCFVKWQEKYKERM